MDGKTYVLDEIEVCLTGRVATRHTRSNRTETKVEVTPKETSNGNWKKWVDVDTLFVVDLVNDNQL